MSNAELLAAAETAVAVLAKVDGPVWENFTCSEIDAVADLMRAAGRPGDAASIIVWHAGVDDANNEDYHAEIGDAVRAQAGVQGIKWVDREGYRLAAEYVGELA